jgi:hypothetical protein
MSMYAVTLSPNSLDHRPKALTIAEGAWKKAVALVEKSGFRPNHFSGLHKLSTKPFANALRQAMDREELEEPTAGDLKDLLDFLAGPGAAGFGLTHGFQSWRRA